MLLFQYFHHYQSSPGWVTAHHLRCCRSVSSNTPVSFFSYSPYKFLLRAGLRAVQVVFDHRSSYMLDSLFSLSMVGMVTELASCVQFQGRVTIYFFFRCRSSYVLRRSLPMFPVFSNLSDLSQKESIKERQNIEVKRTKTKSLVAQTSVVGKLAERLVYDRLMHWLTKHSSLSPLQAGFRKGRNTCEQITVLVDAIVRSHMEEKRSVFLSFDFTAAFDRINHKILLLKLVKMGVPNVIIRWITDFLTNRKVRVEANGYFSEFRTLAKGVPQGSILGPLLYLIYVDDLCKILELEKETTTSALYADDTACVVSGSNMEEALSNAQLVLDKVDQ